MEHATSEPPIKILLVEDNAVDARMTLYALREEQTWLTDVVVAKDGEKAIDYLIEQNSYRNGANPDLVILDLNLPKRDGTEVLRVIRTTAGLESLPVIVFTSSPEEVSEAIVQEANLYANSYMTKPANVDDFLSIGRVFRLFSRPAVTAG
jgi:two-component system, chemotaxis family, response regulator Rcp1